MTLRACAGVIGVALVAIAVACSDETNGGGPPPAVVERAIGPSGGSIATDGVTLDVPEGALASDAQIRVTRTTDRAPDGVAAVSAVYRFEPDGLTFSRPARISFKLDAAESDVTVMWSSSSDRSRYEPLVSTVMAGTITAEVLHFSNGFVARVARGREDSGTPPDAGSEGGDGSSPTCAAGTTACGSVCVSTMTSTSHCGQCFRACGTTTPICFNGNCVAPSG